MAATKGGLKVRVSVRGFKKVIAKINALRKSSPEAVNAALFQEAVLIFADSQRLVPIDFGFLRNSGLVAPAGTLLKFRVVIGYGMEYAEAVHERKDVRHNGETTSHYLEKPYRKRISGILGRVAKRAGRFVEAGAKPKRPTSIGKGEVASKTTRDAARSKRAKNKKR